MTDKKPEVPDTLRALPTQPAPNPEVPEHLRAVATADLKEKPTREKQLEDALKDAIVIIEDQEQRLQRMGTRVLAVNDWVELAKGLVK